jgi:acyl carrier protein
MTESLRSASSGATTGAREQIVDALAAFVREEAVRDEAIGPGTDIIGEGLVDSVGIFKLIAFVEERFGVTIEPHEVLLENFRTLGTLANLIVGKLSGDRERAPLPATSRGDPT